MATEKMTTAQALIRFLANQSIERDGKVHPFFGGVLGIFGHGNVAGIGQALQENPQLTYIPTRNEQSQVHAATAYARMLNRLGAMVCTSSVGPGATNMVTGAAQATINRLPVLLLPGDIFARRNVAPVLQQLESDASQDVSVNDCLRPVSRYWDRINRPDQLLTALPEVMRVLTSPAQTGAVTLCMPQDVQTELLDLPIGFLAPRVWHVPRQRPDQDAVRRAVEAIRSAHSPMIIAGGGAIYSEASAALEALVSATGIPVGETQAGKGAIPWDHPQCLGGVGATGTLAANLTAASADLVIGIGTRYSDFTTASKTAFANKNVRFININVTEFDAIKHDAISLVGDAKVILEELISKLDGYRVAAGYANNLTSMKDLWDLEVDRLIRVSRPGSKLPSQAAVIGALNRNAHPSDVIINAAGSAPGDLHKLWRSRDPKQYHVEYGYSTMGYEIPAAVGVKLASPERHVTALVGDGTFLMCPTEIVTAVQEGLSVTTVVVDNHGFASIGGLSQSLGSGGFGTSLRARSWDGELGGPALPLDFVAMARGMGAYAEQVADIPAFEAALAQARMRPGPSVIVIETDPEARVPGYASWWDVPVAAHSSMPSVQQAREIWESNFVRERNFFARSGDEQ